MARDDFDWFAALETYATGIEPTELCDVGRTDVPPVEWKTALLEDLGAGAASAPRGAELPNVHEAQVLAALRREPRLRSYQPGDALADRGAHRALLMLYYAPHQQRLLTRIARDPFFAIAKQAWQPGSQARQTNLALFYQMYDHLSALMGQVYSFTPAPLGHSEEMPDWAAGMYFPSDGRIRVSQRLLLGSAAFIFALVAHEQIHCFQHVQRQRLRRWELPPLEASLASFWAQEEACRPPGPALHLGTEHQAYLLDREVFRTVTSLPALKALR